MAVAAIACGADELTRPAALGEEFILESGHTAVLAEGALQLKFVRVVADSRCPRGARCIWQGDAEIEIEARARGGERLSLRLHTTSVGGRAQEGPAYGLRVRLVALASRPRLDSEPRERPHATLLVTRD